MHEHADIYQPIWRWCQQGPQGVYLAVMTGPFVLQVLGIKSDKISNVVTAGP